MAKIVVLDAGHGGHDPGAQSGGLREKDLTLDIVKRTINKLKKYNVKVIATRTTDKFISLSGRANIANKNKADLFVSVHINSGGGTGFESFIYNGSIQSSTKSFQNTLHKAIMNKISVNDRGKKSANFAVVRETNMPAVLTENLFVDGDNKSLNQGSVLDNLAQGHADGIAEFLGLKKSSNTKPPKPTQSSKPSTKPNNELGLVDWMKANKMDSSFNNRKKLAAQYGIKGYKGTASQNNKLLSKLKAGKPKPSKPSKPAKKGDQTTNSIVDYLKSIGENSSLSNRKMLAKKYGISNYSGTSAQNTKLLKAMRGGSTPSIPKKTTALKVGNIVTLKKSATRFATGQSILDSVKGKRYKILQVKSDRVLLDKIMSWVNKSDVQ